MRAPRSIAAFVAPAVLLASLHAHAQPAPYGAPPPSAVPAGRTPGTARLNLTVMKGKGEAQLYAARTPKGPYSLICQTPCQADVYPGTPLRVTLTGADESHDFTMTGDPGKDVDIEVRPASKGPLVGGIVMLSFGAIFALIGIVALSAGAGVGGEGSTTVGYVFTGIGAGMTASGIVLIANQTSEPRKKVVEHTPTTAWARTETMASDLTTQRPAPLVAQPSTPIGWAFSF